MHCIYARNLNGSDGLGGAALVATRNLRGLRVSLYLSISNVCFICTS